MESMTPGFVAAAKAGEPVYACDVRAAYEKLPAEESLVVSLVPEGVDERVGKPLYEVRLPRFAAYPPTERKFVVDYFLACVNNLVAGLGGGSMSLSFRGADGEAAVLLQTMEQDFSVRLPRHRRQGRGRSLNVAERMFAALNPRAGADCGYRFSRADDARPRRIAVPGAAGRTRPFLDAAKNLDKRLLLGVDIGGTDIKLAVSRHGRLAGLYEFDWNPGAYDRAEQLIDPIVGLVRLMALSAAGNDEGLNRRIAETIARDFTPGSDAGTLAPAIERVEREAGVSPALFDAIGVSFPDVVVDDLIVGGETPKTLSMRERLGAGFDREFAKITRLADRLGPHVRAGGRVAIINDGPMAAFTTGVEAAARSGTSAGGVFSHTLGTDFGSGFVDAAGGVPDIPLEAYTFTVDLGSFPARAYPAADVRSINNFNNGLPGTMQKIACQSGVFRLAVKYLSDGRPDLVREMRDKGFLVSGENGLFVPTSPRDMRKPFLEHVMELVERERSPEVERVFRDIGRALAAVAEECAWVLGETPKERTLYGRLVKRPECFRLMREGAEAAGSRFVFAAAADDLAATPLMRELAANDGRTVAQFAQAVGAIHYANKRLADPERGGRFRAGGGKPVFDCAGCLLALAFVAALAHTAWTNVHRLLDAPLRRFGRQNDAFRSPLFLDGGKVYFFQADWSLTALDADSGAVVHRTRSRSEASRHGDRSRVRAWRRDGRFLVGAMGTGSPLEDEYVLVDTESAEFAFYHWMERPLFSPGRMYYRAGDGIAALDLLTSEKRTLVRNPLAVFDLFGDGALVLEKGGEGSLSCFDDSGTLLWTRPAPEGLEWLGMFCADDRVSVVSRARDAGKYGLVRFAADGREIDSRELSPEEQGALSGEFASLAGIDYRGGRRRGKGIDVVADKPLLIGDDSGALVVMEVPGGGRLGVGRVAALFSGEAPPAEPGGIVVQFREGTASWRTAGKLRWSGRMRSLGDWRGFLAYYPRFIGPSRFSATGDDDALVFAVPAGKVEAVDRQSGRSRWVYSCPGFAFSDWDGWAAWRFSFPYWNWGESDYLTERGLYRKSLDPAAQKGIAVDGDGAAPDARIVIDPSPQPFAENGAAVARAVSWGIGVGSLVAALVLLAGAASNLMPGFVLLRVRFPFLSPSAIFLLGCGDLVIGGAALLLFARYSNPTACLLLLGACASLVVVLLTLRRPFGRGRRRRGSIG